MQGGIHSALHWAHSCLKHVEKNNIQGGSDMTGTVYTCLHV